MKVQKTLLFCFVKYAACACCLHLFNRRDIFTAKYRLKTWRQNFTNFPEIHRFTIFPYHTFRRKLSLAPLIASVQIFRPIFCSRFLEKIRLEHNSIAPLSLDIPSLDHRAIRRTTVSRTIDRTNTAQKLYIHLRRKNSAIFSQLQLREYTIHASRRESISQFIALNFSSNPFS